MTDTTIATPAIRPFHIDDDDRVMLLSEWRQLRRMSHAFPLSKASHPP